MVLLALVALLLAQRWNSTEQRRPTAPLEPDYGGIVCSALRPKVDDFVAGRLDADTAAKIAAHVALCPPCQRLVDDARARPAQAAGNQPPRAKPGLAVLVARTPRPGAGPLHRQRTD